MPVKKKKRLKDSTATPSAAASPAPPVPEESAVVPLPVLPAIRRRHSSDTELPTPPLPSATRLASGSSVNAPLASNGPRAPLISRPTADSSATVAAPKPAQSKPLPVKYLPKQPIASTSKASNAASTAPRTGAPRPQPPRPTVPKSYQRFGPAPIVPGSSFTAQDFIRPRADSLRAPSPNVPDSTPSGPTEPPPIASTSSLSNKRKRQSSPIEITDSSVEADSVTGTIEAPQAAERSAPIDAVKPKWMRANEKRAKKEVAKRAARAAIAAESEGFSADAVAAVPTVEEVLAEMQQKRDAKDAKLQRQMKGKERRQKREARILAQVEQAEKDQEAQGPQVSARLDKSSRAASLAAQPLVEVSESSRTTQHAIATPVVAAADPQAAAIDRFQQHTL